MEQTQPLMSKWKMLRMLLLGFLPILVFIVVEAVATHFYGEAIGIKAGLITALVIGVISFISVWLKEHRFDGFILLDTALLMGLGGISLISNDPLFFKLKPALIELIMLALLAVSAFTSKSIIMNMTGRYLKGIEFNQEQLEAMTHTMRIMFYIVLVHEALLIYSVFYMSQKMWAFISGPLLYICMLALPAGAFIKQRLFQPKDEMIVDIVDKAGKVIGRSPLDVCAKNPTKRFQMLIGFIANSKEQLLLCKKPDTSETPELWTAPVLLIPPSGSDHDALIAEEFKKISQMQRIPFELVTAVNVDSDRGSRLVKIFKAYASEVKPLQTENPLEMKYWKWSELEDLNTRQLIEIITSVSLHVLKESASGSMKKQKSAT